jgi:hypothetical protein
MMHVFNLYDCFQFFLPCSTSYCNAYFDSPSAFSESFFFFFCSIQSGREGTFSESIMKVFHAFMFVKSHISFLPGEIEFYK